MLCAKGDPRRASTTNLFFSFVLFYLNDTMNYLIFRNNWKVKDENSRWTLETKENNAKILLHLLEFFDAYSLFHSHCFHLQHQLAFLPLGLQGVLIIGLQDPHSNKKSDKIKRKRSWNDPQRRKTYFPLFISISQQNDGLN